MVSLMKLRERENTRERERIQERAREERKESAKSVHKDEILKVLENILILRLAC